MAIFEYLFATGVAGAGVGVGWWLRGAGAGATPNELPTAAPVAAPAEAPASNRAAEDEARAKAVLAKLHELAARMAAEVGAHAKNVQAINNDLRAPGAAANPEDVFAAVDKLIQVNSQMQSKLQSAESKLEEQAKEIETQSTAARTDGLSNLYNRRALDDELARRVAEFQRHGRAVCFMMIDVDHFKKFNDTHGHQAGDAVIKGVGRVLKQMAREMDFCARYGGEEFAVIFPGTKLDDARKAAERMRQAITQAAFDFEGVSLRVTSSAGVAEILPGESAELLLKRADEALYKAKQAGRNQGQYHDGQEIHPIGAPAPAKPAAAVAAALPTPPAKTPPVAPPAKAPPAAWVGDESLAMESPVDLLSKLSNRLTFCEDVQRRVAEWKRGGATVSVLLVQLDNYEHLRADGLADTVLRAAVQFMKATMRDMDHVARFDDATFGLLLPAASLASAAKVSERLRVAVERTKLRQGDKPVQFTVSLGLAEATTSDDAESLIRRCEAALDAAVKNGRNCIFYERLGNCQSVDVNTVKAGA